MAQIHSIEELRQTYKFPSERAANKEITELDEHSKSFIELSSYFIISSIDEDGFIDTSPRGGEPGFVKVLNSKELMFPDSKGNNRLDTFSNILRNPKVGLMFCVQGVDETLRVKGELSLFDDEDLIEFVEDSSFKASLAIRFKVHKALFHCGKAAMRSGLWGSKYRINRSEFPSIAQIMKDQQNLNETPISQDEIVSYYRETL